MDEDRIDDLVANVQAEHERVAEMQRSLERLETIGRSRNNGVTARLRGTQLIDIVIDPRVAARYDLKAIGAFVVEAVNDAFQRYAEASRRTFAPYIAEARAIIDSFQ
jgi:DNA-binding protein YbaB